MEINERYSLNPAIESEASNSQAMANYTEVQLDHMSSEKESAGSQSDLIGSREAE